MDRAKVRSDPGTLPAWTVVIPLVNLHATGQLSPGL